jgi:hypothetical protein
MLKVEYRVLSEPAVVWWAGFRSDTLRLQQAGWEIAAEEDVAYNCIRLILRHQNMRLYALTNEVEYNYRALMVDPGCRSALEFNVVAAAPKFEVHRFAGIGPVEFENFRQIDAQPQVAQNVEIKSLDDFRIFATPLTRTEEIIVEPRTVSAMLEQIRKMQVPEQERIRQKERLAARRAGESVDAGPRQQFHAQIISLAERRAA